MQAVAAISLKYRPPRFEPKFGSDVKQLCERLGYFCQHNVLGSDGTTKVVHGKEAFDLIYNGVAQKVAAGQAMSTKDYLHLWRFHWLLSPEQEAELTKWKRSLKSVLESILAEGDAADEQQDDAAAAAGTNRNVRARTVNTAVDDTFA